MSVRRRLACVAVTVALLGALAGCGGGARRDAAGAGVRLASATGPAGTTMPDGFHDGRTHLIVTVDGGGTVPATRATSAPATAAAGAPGPGWVLVHAAGASRRMTSAQQTQLAPLVVEYRADAAGNVWGRLAPGASAQGVGGPAAGSAPQASGASPASARRGPDPVPAALAALPDTVVTPLGGGRFGVVTSLAASAVRALPGVTAVEDDHLATIYGSPSSFVPRSFDDPLGSRQWGLENDGDFGVNTPGDSGPSTAGADGKAAAAWARSRGSGVIVADIDAGFDPTIADLRNQLWQPPGEICGNGKDDDGNGYVDDCGGWDFVTNRPLTAYAPGATTGHGTSTAGVIAAQTNNGVGIAGVAPDARLMLLQVSTSSSIPYSLAISALDYAVANGARIVNASWGGAVGSPALEDAIRRAEAAGVLFVDAAGNSGQNLAVTPAYPASYTESNVVTVAASTPTDTRASFSNYGGSTAIVAPGQSIVVALPGNQYGVSNGTSFSSPYVAGVAALLLGADPSMSAATLRDRLLSSADRVGALGGVSASGRVNALTAVSGVHVDTAYTFAGFGALDDSGTQPASVDTVVADPSTVPAGARLGYRLSLGAFIDNQLWAAGGATFGFTLPNGVSDTVTTGDDGTALVDAGGFAASDAPLTSTGATLGLSSALPVGTYALLAQLVDLRTGASVGHGGAVVFDVHTATSPTTPSTTPATTAPSSPTSPTTSPAPPSTTPTAPSSPTTAPAPVTPTVPITSPPTTGPGQPPPTTPTTAPTTPTTAPAPVLPTMPTTPTTPAPPAPTMPTSPTTVPVPTTLPPVTAPPVTPPTTTPPSTTPVPTIPVPPGPVAIPGTPVGLVAQPGDASATLTWSAAPGAAPLGYRVYRDGQFVAQTSDPSWVATGLQNGRTYAFAVSAYTTAGESARTGDVAVTPQAGLTPVTTSTTAATPQPSSPVTPTTTVPGLAVSPAHGSVGGWALAVISGSSLPFDVTGVRFGGVDAQLVGLNPPASITVLTPPHAAGTVDVDITRANGATVTIANGYTYDGAPTSPTTSPPVTSPPTTAPPPITPTTPTTTPAPPVTSPPVTSPPTPTSPTTAPAPTPPSTVPSAPGAPAPNGPLHFSALDPASPLGLLAGPLSTAARCTSTRCAARPA